MKTLPSTLNHSTRWLAAATLAAGLGASAALAEDKPAKTATEAGREAASRAAEQVEAYSEESTDLNKAEVKAALAELDAQIEHLEALADSAPDDAHRQAVNVRIDALKERRDAIKADFNQARFAELKADVRREWTDFKAWLNDKTDGVDEEDDRVATDDADVDRRDTSDYVVAPETGGAPVATNRDSAYADAGEDNAEALEDRREIALDRIDRELDRIEARVDDLDDEARQAQVEERLNSLRERRDELKADFTDERYTALMKDILSEAEQTRAVAE